MTSEQFCYWLQGYFELKQTIDHREGATPETMKMIEDHLKTVFVKVTPEVSKPARQPSYEEILKALQPQPIRPFGPNHPAIGYPLTITC